MKKIILVTGSTDGIGKATALHLARMGHKVVIHGRNEHKALLAKKEIAKITNNKNLEIVWADLSSQKQILNMAKNLYSMLNHLDVLINNAGVYQPRQEFSIDNIEMTFAINHLAPFILSQLLLDLIKKSNEGRIVTVSSMIHSHSIDFNNLQGEKYYEASNAYSQSKLCNLLFAYKLADFIKETKITSNALHPGVVSTKLLHKGWGGGGISPQQGAENSVYVATSDEIKGITQKYFVNKKISREAEIARDRKIQQRLWEESLHLCLPSIKQKLPY